MLMIFLGVCQRSPGGERRKRGGLGSPRGCAPAGGGPAVSPGQRGESRAGPALPAGRQLGSSRGTARWHRELRPGRRGRPRTRLPRAGLGSGGSPGTAAGPARDPGERGPAAKGTSQAAAAAHLEKLARDVWVRVCVYVFVWYFWWRNRKAEYVSAGGVDLGQGP